MKNRVMKVLDLADKIVSGELPRFVADKDILEACLLELRACAVIADINKEETVNAIVDISDKLENKVYDWDLKQKHKNFYKPQYVPICICVIDVSVCPTCAKAKAKKVA